MLPTNKKKQRHFCLCFRCDSLERSDRIEVHVVLLADGQRTTQIGLDLELAVLVDEYAAQVTAPVLLILNFECYSGPNGDAAVPVFQDFNFFFYWCVHMF